MTNTPTPSAALIAEARYSAGVAEARANRENALLKRGGVADIFVREQYAQENAQWAHLATRLADALAGAEAREARLRAAQQKYEEAGDMAVADSFDPAIARAIATARAAGAQPAEGADNG